MNIKRALQRHSFFIRIIITLLVFIYIPVLLYSYTIIKAAYNEYEEASAQIDKASLNSYSGYFSEQFSKMRIIASKIWYEGKIDPDYITKNSFHVLESTEELENYRACVPIVSRIGVYFGNEYVYTDQGRISLAGYLKEVIGGNYGLTSTESNQDSPVTQEILDILTSFKDTYCIYSTYNKVNRQEKLYIFMPIQLKSKYSGNTMVIFELANTTFQYSTTNADPVKNYNFGILDVNGDLLYSDSNILLRAFSQISQDSSQADSYSGNLLRVDGQEYTVYMDHHSKLGLTYMMLVSQVNVESSLEAFYRTLRGSTVFIIAVFVVLCVAAAYLNYRPIIMLVKQVTRVGIGNENRTKIQNEINTITNAIEDLNLRNIHLSETISVQADLLINNTFERLIEGLSVDEEQLEKLNLCQSGFCYCVLIFSASNFQEKEMHNFIKYIMQKHNNIIQLIDIPANPNMAAICSLPDETRMIREKTAKVLLQELESWKNNNYKIGVGTAQNTIIDIRTSYLTALSAYETEQQGEIILFEEAVESYTQVKAYPTENILKLLQSIKQGDKKSAIIELDQISDYMDRNISLTVMRRYFYSTFVNTLITTLMRLNIHLALEEIDRIIRYDDLEIMQDAIQEFVVKTCDKVSAIKKNKSDELIREIVDYVDNNYRNPNLGLSDLSANFDLPDYTISRMFKKATNQGFTEYVMLKRIEFSKLQLLFLPEKTMKDLALESGFRDTSYFIKTFKKVSGMTPKKYRTHYYLLDTNISVTGQNS